MRAHRGAGMRAERGGGGAQRAGERTGITARPERADCAVPGQRPQRRNVRDDRRQAGGERLDQREAAAFAMATEHE